MFDFELFGGSVFDDMDVPGAYRGTWESDNCPGIAWESDCCANVRESAIRDSISDYERSNEWN